MVRCLVVAFLVALLAGCGGSDRGARLTKAQYASQADAICGKYNKQVKALDVPTSLQELADVSDQTIPVLHKAIGELRQLNPPASEQDTADEWLDEVEKLEDDLEEIRDKANDNDMQGVRDVVPKAEAHNKRSNELATQLGMSVCNSD